MATACEFDHDFGLLSFGKKVVAALLASHCVFLTSPDRKLAAVDYGNKNPNNSKTV
jgi:hypothetical protein